MYEKREDRRCKVCGKRLIGKYYYAGRCSKHQTVKSAGADLTRDASAAKALGLTYGQYMALKKED